MAHPQPTNAEEFAARFEIQTGFDENQDATFSSDPNDFGITWDQVQAKVSEIEAGLPIELLRDVRNGMIAETDWTQAPDSPLDAADKSAWQNYRQALRDITQTYTSLDDVVWPTKPGEEV